MITIPVESSQKAIRSQDLFFPSHICADSPDLVYEATMKWERFRHMLGLSIHQKEKHPLDFVRFCSYKYATRSYSNED